MPSLNVVIGIILVLLFYSLLATIAMEVVSGYRSMRGKHLETILRGLLSSADRREEVFRDFTESPLYQQISGRIYGKNTPPSYLSAATFRSILVRLIGRQGEGGASFREKIDQLPDETLKSSLLQLWDEAFENGDEFGKKVERWYDEVMERASGWYKRNVQKGLLVIGLVIAVGFNVDVLSVYSHLVRFSQTDMEQLTEVANLAAAQTYRPAPVAGDSVTAVLPPSAIAPDTGGLDTQELYELMNAKLASLENPLGLGWESVTPTPDIRFWLFKIFGWLVTALCISKGAPFWFDLLKKVVNFRDSGNPPAQWSAATLPYPAEKPAAATPATASLAQTDERADAAADGSASSSSQPVG
jgi:hypothetical protein